MARTVAEIMNRELVSVPEGTSDSVVRRTILGMGITAVPVLDGEGHPTGILSLRDVVDAVTLAAPAQGPVTVIAATATIEDASRLLASTDYHHLVVVDAGGKAVGMVSAVDLLRGLLGIPVRHPAAFPHIDPELGEAWTDDELLAADRLSVAPEGPGVVVLIRGGGRVVESPVWVEACERVHTRLEEILSIPQSDSPALAAILRHRDLRYRAAAIADPERRERVVRALHERIDHLPVPASAQ
jgi:CBS domain-containing protein